MCRKVVSVVMLLLACSVSCWGEARPLAYTDQRSIISEPPSQPLSTLWQKADESLRIIEESLIAQGEPVQSLSISLPELYQKSQELQENVNALLQQFESLAEYLIKLDRNIISAINETKSSTINSIMWNTLVIAGFAGVIAGIASTLIH